MSYSDFPLPAIDLSSRKAQYFMHHFFCNYFKEKSFSVLSTETWSAAKAVFTVIMENLLYISVI